MMYCEKLKKIEKALIERYIAAAESNAPIDDHLKYVKTIKDLNHLIEDMGSEHSDLISSKTNQGEIYRAIEKYKKIKSNFDKDKDMSYIIKAFNEITTEWIRIAAEMYQNCTTEYEKNALVSAVRQVCSL